MHVSRNQRTIDQALHIISEYVETELSEDFQKATKLRRNVGRKNADDAFQIQNLLVAYKERFDKDNFIKNLLLDNLLLVDIYNRAKKLHIDTDVRRVCIH